MLIVRRITPYLFFFLLSLAPLLWIPQISQSQFIGHGDYLSPYKVDQDFNKLLFIYNKAQYGGMDTSIEIATIIPYWIIIFISHVFTLSPVIGTLIYISISILIAQVSMFLWLKHELKSHLEITLLCIFGAIIYAYSPYLAVYIWPGQMNNYSIYTLLPLIFLLIGKIFRKNLIKWQIFILYFFILSFSTNGGSWGIGTLYAIFWAIAGYGIIYAIVYQISLVKQIQKIFTIIFLILLTNSYWLIPWLFSGIFQAKLLGSPINNDIDASSYYASITGLLLGRSDLSILYIYQPAILSTVSFGFLITGLLIGFYFLGKSKQFMVNSGMLLFSLFITKGVNPPFGNIFSWLFNHFPGFTMFRRPVNKFSGVYLLFFITAGLLGYLALENTIPKYRKILRIIIYCLLCLGSSVLIYPIASEKLLSAFTVPNYYEEAWTQISSEKVSRILLLPGLYGVQPTFGTKLNNYHGFDFLYYIWDTSIVYPDKSDYSPAYQIKNPTTSLVEKILKETDVCELTRELALSHIVIRQDLDKSTTFELSPSEYYEKVKKSNIWVSEKFYGSGEIGLNVFTIKPECRNPRILIKSPNTDLHYFTTPITNTKYILNIQSDPSEFSIYLFDNYSPWWKLIPGDLSNNTWLTDMLLIFKPQILFQSHQKAYDWSNQWNIPSENQIEKYTLYYLPQSAVYLGIGFWILSIAGITIYKLFLNIQK
jgi:hypothetical protein